MKRLTKIIPEFVRGGANRKALLVLALAAASPGFAALTVQAQNGVFDKNDVENADTLRQRAQTAGSVRLELVLKLPAALEAQDIFTEAGLQARTASITQLVQNFKQAHLAYFPGAFVSATLTPFIDADVTPAGIDALMQNPDVIGFSDTTLYQEALKQTNVSLETALLPPVPVGLLGNTMIAIIDSGVAGDHPSFRNLGIPGPDFESRLVLGACSSTPETTALPSICNVAPGGPCASDSQIAGVAGALDNCGHGTHVAGIAASATGSQATSGMMPNVGIMSYQASSLKLDLNGNPERVYRNIDVLRALQFVFANRNFQGRKLVAVNMSFGTILKPRDALECNGLSEISDPLATTAQLRSAISNLRNAGVSVVAATGNSVEGMAFPACATEGPFNLPQQRTVISVGATNKDFSQADYSQFGFSPSFVASIIAPGGNLTGTTIPGCGISGNSTGVCSPSAKHASGTAFELRAGTSMAAPHVAGILARLRERFPAATRAQVENIVIGSGVPTVITGYEPGIIPQSFNTIIPRIAPFPAFRQASVSQNITASTATCGQINLNWQAPSIMQATGYKVRSASTLAGLAAAAITSTTNGATSFTISNVNQPQFAQILAVDAQGDGAWSDSVSATPTPCAPAAISSIQIVGPPTQCTDTTFLGCRTVQWSATANATQYELEHSFSTSFTGTATRTITTTSDSVRYGFAKIRACNTTCGPWSGTLAVDAGQNE